MAEGDHKSEIQKDDKPLTSEYEVERQVTDLDLTPFRCKSQVSNRKEVQLEFRMPEESRKKD
eukprot:7506291-Karenia_brevis.AAC.1